MMATFRQQIANLGRYFIDDLLYNELAWTYDAVSWGVSLGDWQRWGQASLPYIQGNDVLEIAFGRGHLLPVLSKQYNVTGIDLSPYMVRVARRRGAGVPLVRGSVTQLPFAAKQFDSVVSTFPAGFITQPATLAGVWRVLKPGGRFVIVPGARLTQPSAAKSFVDWLYKLTGQEIDQESSNTFNSWRDYFTTFNFDTTLHTATFERSAATIIVATKRQNAASDIVKSEPEPPTHAR